MFDLQHILGFFLSIFLLIKSASYTVKSMANLARFFRISEFIISLIIFGFVSSLPETSIALIAALKGASEIGYGILMGSNIADLSLILGLVILIGGKLRVKERKTAKDLIFISLAALPILVGWDHQISRIDGMILIAACCAFLYHVTKERNTFQKIHHPKEKPFEIAKQTSILLVSLLILFASATFVVKFTQLISADVNVPALLIAITLLALGTCLPELSFAIASLKQHHDDLAVGDILGNVIIDATLILGITALIQPIIIEQSVLIVTGIFLVIIIAMVLSLLRYRKELTYREGILLVFTYLMFMFVELAIKGF